MLRGERFRRFLKRLFGGRSRVKERVMIRLGDALIVGLWVIAIACAISAIWAEERRGFLVLALITGSLAAYASYRRAR